MLNAQTFDRRSSLLDALLTEHVTGVAADAIAAETATLRHERRAAKAKEAAIDSAREHVAKDAPDSAVPAFAAGLCLLDAMGVGGRFDVEGAAPARLPAFAGLGKGRKQAVDGGAWSAAIEAARTEIGWEVVGGRGQSVTLWLSPFGEDGLVVVVRPRDVESSSPEYQSAECTIQITPSRAAWLLTAAREGLRRSCGLAAWHDLPGVEFEDDAKNWGNLVNAIDAARTRWTREAEEARARESGLYAAQHAAGHEGDFETALTAAGYGEWLTDYRRTIELEAARARFTELRAERAAA